MIVGSLLQYRENCYGRYHPKLPVVPFDNHHFLASTNRNVFELQTLTHTGAFVSAKQQARKKFILFCAQVDRVLHPRTSLVGCNYLKCFISDPYVAGATIDGWVREEWVEPLNEEPTYYDEHMKMIRERYIILNRFDDEKPFRDIKKIFHDLQLAQKETDR